MENFTNRDYIYDKKDFISKTKRNNIIKIIAMWISFATFIPDFVLLSFIMLNSDQNSVYGISIYIIVLFWFVIISLSFTSFIMLFYQTTAANDKKIKSKIPILSDPEFLINVYSNELNSMKEPWAKDLKIIEVNGDDLKESYIRFEYKGKYHIKYSVKTWTLYKSFSYYRPRGKVRAWNYNSQFVYNAHLKGENLANNLLKIKEKDKHTIEKPQTESMKFNERFQVDSIDKFTTVKLLSPLAITKLNDLPKEALKFMEFEVYDNGYWCSDSTASSKYYFDEIGNFSFYNPKSIEAFTYKIIYKIQDDLIQFLNFHRIAYAFN